MMKSVTKEKVFHVLKLVLLAVTVTLVLAAANLSAQARAEELSLEDFAGLAIQLQNIIR